MDTWVSTSYLISSKSTVFINSVSLAIDSVSGLPYIRKKHKDDYKEMELANEGDVIFCINDTYFTSTSEFDIQSRLLHDVLGKYKWLTVKLISTSSFVKRRVPRIEQIIIPDNNINIIPGTYQTDRNSFIMSISSKLFSSICGSVLLAINDEIIISKDIESIRELLNFYVSPLVLLIACPYQHCPITRPEILDYMSHNGISTNSSSSYFDIDNGGQHSSSVPSISNAHDLQSSFNQIDYATRPYVVDSFMFPQSQGYSILEQQWIRSTFIRQERNVIAWHDFLNSIGGAEKLNYSWTRQSGKRWELALTQESRQRRQLRSLIHNGIPTELRGAVWYHLSGGQELKSRSMNSFQQLWQSQGDSHVQKLIDSDLPRTFPTHPLFSQGVSALDHNSASSHAVVAEEAPFIRSLRHILLGISVIRDDIQYCQGMNLLGGMLLLVLMDEEKAFWTMAAVMQYVFPPRYFDDTLSGARVDELVFESMIMELHPELYRRMHNFNPALISLSLSWFMNMFINYLPISSVARIWDVLMMEGDKTLLRVAMTLISLSEDSLLDGDDDQMVIRFRQIGSLQFNVDLLFDVAYRKRNIFTGELSVFPYSRKQILALREQKRCELEKMKNVKLVSQIENSDSE